MSEKPVLPVTRENLSSGKLAALVAERNDAETQLATDEQLLASRRAVVPDDADTSDIWVFGYGSLIFNPVMDFVDRASGVSSAITGGSACAQGLAAAHPTARALYWRWIAAEAAPESPSS